MASLFIIGGPNGAGKSTTSKYLLLDEGLTAFDYDLEFHDLWSKFDFDPAVEEGVRERIANKFMSLKDEALNHKKSFAFETNYNSLASYNVAEQFAKSGHETKC